MTEEEEKAIEELESATNIFNYVVTYEKDYLIESIKVVLNLIQKLQEENKKKDKIIDLMAEELENQFLHCEPCWLDNEVKCKNYSNCIDCIKQYFEEKVEEIKDEK